jgi:feruloyl esterase
MTTLRGSKRALLLCGTLLLATQEAVAQTEQQACEALTGLDLPDVAIQSAEAVDDPVPHCAVRGTIGGNIGFVARLPERWNGRFVMGGAGGFVTPEDNQARRFLPGSVLERGFATASSDTGHTARTAVDASWAQDDMEAIVNFAHLGMHRTVVTAKALIAERYGQPTGKAFFFGCSNGGRQALLEAQRYPGDFDAIVAGAPALDWTGVMAAFLQIAQRMAPDPASPDRLVVTPEQRRGLGAAVLGACDGLDGVVDGVLNDPRRCAFDPAVLACADDGSPSCLTPEALAAVRTVYDGPGAVAGRPFPGFPRGAEAAESYGWGAWFTGEGAIERLGGRSAAAGFGLGFMRHFVRHDPTWTYAGYDFADYAQDTRPVGASLNARDPDLSAFRARGGKLLLYHGWADTALTPYMSIDYFERVLEHDRTAADDVRLFMMPGMLHCAGGPGPSVVDWLSVVERWHDTGAAPEEVVAGWPDRDGGRPLCAWPKVARFDGGNADSPTSWSCR